MVQVNAVFRFAVLDASVRRIGTVFISCLLSIIIISPDDDDNAQACRCLYPADILNRAGRSDGKGCKIYDDSTAILLADRFAVPTTAPFPDAPWQCI